MEQLNAFIKKAQSDPELLEKLNSLGASDEKTEEIIALAAEHGFTVTQEDIDNAKKSGGAGCKRGELREEELDAVAGGGATQNRWNPDVCLNYNHPHYWCVGFFASHWCDHYRKTLISKSGKYGSHRVDSHSCVMGVYTDVIRDGDGAW